MIWLQVALAIGVVLVCVLWLRLHALLALLAAGLLVAVLTPTAALETYAEGQVDKQRWTAETAQDFITSGPAERLATAFGATAGNVGILIALASIIGICLLDSGAAQAIIERTLALTGPRRAPEALLASSFVLGIPVFFDTVFYLMVPLARSLRQTLGRDYVLFILAILAGGSLAHSLVPPTPGPLQVADTLQIDVATMMLTGLGICACSSVVSLLAARAINHFVEVPLRPIAGQDDDVSVSAATPTESPRIRPPVRLALLPIALPVLLIGLGTATRMTVGNIAWVDFLADKNVALGIAAVVALTLLRYVPDQGGGSQRRARAVQQALASGGVIILITAAGGAFGAMLRQAGIAAVIGQLAGGSSGLSILVIAFLVTTAIRTLQGSSTVAMITAAGLMQDFATSGNLPFHPVYLAMAIGAGSKPIAWMTDSGFWVICKMSGMTEAEGLKTVSPMSTAMGLSALLITLLAATLFP